MNNSSGIASWDKFIDDSKIPNGDDVTGFSRLEVIDENGRAYVRTRGVETLRFSVQDTGRTLKIFVN